MTQEEIKDIALCGETSTVQFKVTVWRTLQKNDDTHLEILSGKITDKETDKDVLSGKITQKTADSTQESTQKRTQIITTIVSREYPNDDDLTHTENA